MSTGWSTLDHLIDSIPSGSNPYTFIEGFVQKLVHNSSIAGSANPTAFVANLSVLIGIYAACCLASVFTIIVKWKHGSFWLFRLRETKHGTVLSPNTMCMFTIWTFMFTACASVYLGLLIATLHGQTTPVPAEGLMAAMWIPLCLALLSEAHGMAVAIFLSKPEHKVFNGRVTLHAQMINLIALVIYVFEIAALIPYFALGAQATQRVYNDLDLFIGWLAGKAEAWQAPAPFALDFASIGVLFDLRDDGLHSVRYLGNGFKVFFFCLLASAVIFVPFAFLYLRLLRKQMRTADQRRRSASSYEKGDESSSVYSKESDRLESLSTSYRLMTLETFMVLFLIAAYLAITGWVAWDTNHILSSSSLIMTYNLLFYWFWAVLGAPISALVAYRSWTAYRQDLTFTASPALSPSPFSASPRSVGSPHFPEASTIYIHRDVSVDVERGDSDSSQTLTRPASLDEKDDKFFIDSSNGLGLDDKGHSFMHV